MQLIQTVKNAFNTHFSGTPVLVQSPGRINILGEHTDYNEGFVLPAAIDKSVVFAGQLNSQKRYRFISLDLQETFDANHSALTKSRWANYLLGVIAQLEKRNIQVPGLNLVFGGDLPIGAGISSSAAIECGMLFLLNKLLALHLSRAEMAQMAQTAEREYAGVNCGIMDQFAVLHGESEHVIKLDCRSLDYSLLPLNLQNHHWVLCDSQVKHSLANSAYNQRRAECDECVQVLAQNFSVKSLRDATLEQLQQIKSQLSFTVFQRGKFVIEENLRVQKACAALTNCDLNSLGQLMYQTHAGLRDDYQVSCAELDLLVNIALDVDGVLGSRIMGGGFGGCSLNLVTDTALDTFIARVTQHYYTPKHLVPNVIITNIGAGTRLCQI